MKRARNELSLKECYTILKLKKGATLEDVKRAYRTRAFELHPDLNPGNPQAGIDFQVLNEAYVLLAGLLERDEAEKNAAKERAQAKAEASRQEQADNAAREQEEQAARAKVKEEEARAEQERKAQEAKKAQSQSNAHDTDANRKKAAESAYGQSDVLHDILNDPFARRVFEDIYSEINKKSADTPPNSSSNSNSGNNSNNNVNSNAANQPVPPIETTNRFLKFEWGDNKSGVSFKNGVGGAVKGWLRNQIDEEQTFKLPAASLFPGARIRLRIRRGFSDELTTIELILPRDFVLGKPVRLRGLGKKVGPWQGDMYLRLERE